MASMMGYVVTLIGLSILLGFAGVNTLGNGFMNLIGMNITTSTLGTTTIAGGESVGTLSMPYFSALAAIIAGLLVIGSLALSSKFDIGASLKLPAAILFLGVAVNEFRAVWAVAVNSSWSYVLLPLFCVIYAVLISGLAVTLYNWVGGNN